MSNTTQFPPRFKLIDPEKEREADKRAAACGFTNPYSQPRPLLREALSPRQLYEAQTAGWVAEQNVGLAMEQPPRLTRWQRSIRGWRLKLCSVWAHRWQPEGNEHFGIQRMRCSRCGRATVERRRHLGLLG